MKKKATGLLFIFLIFCLLLGSCSTSAPAETNVDVEDLTESDAAYALEYALTTALIDAGQQMIQDIRTRKMIPVSYSVLDENRNSIPGLNSLLNSWDEEFSIYLISSFEKVLENVNTVGANIKFDNPFAFVNESDTSASDYFLKLHGNSILTYIYSVAANADYTTLEKARNQYNIYIRTSNFVYGTSEEELPENNNASEFGTLFYNNFVQLLRNNERLFRTTPDPYLDPRVKAVFGNN